MVLDLLYVKDQLLNNKPFLENLYKGSSKQNSRLLDRASELQIDILIKVLFLICDGEIHLTKENYESLKRARRLNFLKKHFNSSTQFYNTLSLPTEKKLTILKNFCAVYRELFFTFFNQIS